MPKRLRASSLGGSSGLMMAADYKEKKMHESLTLCGQCGKQTVERVKIEYTARKRVGDAIVEFKVPDCPIGKCSNIECNSQWFDWESCQAIDKEFLLIVAEILEMEAKEIRGGLRSQ